MQLAVIHNIGVLYKKSELEEQLPRNTIKEVYTEINNDLDVAITALNGLSRRNKSHINQSVAQGIKAKVALTMEHGILLLTLLKKPEKVLLSWIKLHISGRVKHNNKSEKNSKLFI